MKKLILILLFLSITITGAFASSSNFQETLMLKAKSCFDLLSKKRNEMLPEDIEGTENYLKKKMDNSHLARFIIQEVYIEETNKLSDIVSEYYDRDRLQNLRITGIRLGLDSPNPIRLFDPETDSEKSIAIPYERNNDCICNIY